MKKNLLIFLIPLFLISCSAIKYGYKMIDWYISSSISSKYDLYLRQSEKLSSDVDEFLNTRSSDFIQLDEFLTRLENTISEKKLAEIKNLQTQGQLLYENVASDFNQILIKYFLILNDSQKKHFKKVLEKENKEIKEKAEEQSSENLKEGLEYILGDLTDEQNKLFKKYQDSFIKSQNLRLEARLELHKIMFKEKLTREELSLAFHKYVKKELHKADEFKKVDQAYHDLFTGILKLATKAQQKKAKEVIKETKDKIKDIRSEKF